MICWLWWYKHCCSGIERWTARFFAPNVHIVVATRDTTSPRPRRAQFGEGTIQSVRVRTSANEKFVVYNVCVCVRWRSKLRATWVPLQQRTQTHAGMCTYSLTSTKDDAPSHTYTYTLTNVCDRMLKCCTIIFVVIIIIFLIIIIIVWNIILIKFVGRCCAVLGEALSGKSSLARGYISLLVARWACQSFDPKVWIRAVVCVAAKDKAGKHSYSNSHTGTCGNVHKHRNLAGTHFSHLACVVVIICIQVHALLFHVIVLFEVKKEASIIIEFILLSVSWRHSKSRLFLISVLQGSKIEYLFASISNNSKINQ